MTPDTIAPMNPIALYFASGESLYLGAILLLLMTGVSLFLKHNWLWCLRNVGAWLALVLIVMACPPFTLLIDLVFIAAFVLWFIAWNREASTRTWMRLRQGSAVVLMLLLPVLTVVEFSHRTVPVITGKPSDHLVVIGDSISAGIDPSVPAWPLILQQTTGVYVRNLAMPGAQVSDGLTMARKLTPDERVVPIEISGNDLLMGVSSAQFGQNLDALLSSVTAPGRTVAMFELPLLPHKIAYGQIQRRLAARYGVWLIPKRYFAEVIGGANATIEGLIFRLQGHAAWRHSWQEVCPQY